MNISQILKELNIEHTVYGDVEVEQLGLLQSEVGAPICSFIQNHKYIGDASQWVKVILVDEKNYEYVEDKFEGVCVLDNPRDSFFLIHNYLCNNYSYCRPKFKSRIGKNCKISPLSYIAEHNVEIGDNVTIEEFASIKENTVIKDGAIVRAGSVIGGQGFEFKKTGESMFHVTHVGGVIIEERADIHHNVAVDKGIYPWDDTVIGKDTKLDNLIHIAHGVKLGDRVMIVANTCVAGRTQVGDDAWIGPVSAIRNGLKLGKNSRVNMGAVVTRNVGDGESVSGNFAIDHKKLLAHVKKLDKEI